MMKTILRIVLVAVVLLGVGYAAVHFYFATAEDATEAAVGEVPVQAAPPAGADQIEAQGKQINALQKQITEQSDKYTKELSESKVEVEKMKGKVREVEESGRRKRSGLVAAVIVLGVLLVAAVMCIVIR